MRKKLKFLHYGKWKQLFFRYNLMNWIAECNDKHYGNVYFTVEDEVYLTLDVIDGVYVEEFKSIEDMEEFYEMEVNYRPGVQLTLF